MRLKKGSKVEVLHSGKTLPNGFWRPAQILSGNGRTYSVQFDHISSSPVKVARKAIRPSPPLKNQKTINWAAGDLAEVYIHGSWANGRVTGVAYGNEFYFVMLIDQSREIAVRRNNLRLRHVWKNNKWVTIKKDSDSESTGSCSTSGRLHDYNYTSFRWEDGDEMSSYEPTKKTETRSDEESNREAHRMELDEYVATLRELHAAGGSITWEQEAMLADLRIYLNISHDEHRSALRSLGPS